MAHRTVGVALIGGGTVGGGVARILSEQGALLRGRTGLDLSLRHVVVRDPTRRGREGWPVHTDVGRAIDDPAVDVVAELIGGTTTAFDVISAALKSGKRVVTANKALLAARGPELFALARDSRSLLAFEASCAGGIPIINALSQGLVANRIDALVGIVNGTCNYILTEMTRSGMSYGDALAGAQKLGFAEADPTMDVSGRDAAQKLALLASIAFDTRVLEEQIELEGIDTLDAADIKFAGELGYIVKLLAIARRVDGAISLRVAPTLVAQEDMLSRVSGSFNAVSIHGSAVGHSLFYGRGAGSLPTASAVVSDIIAVAHSPAESALLPTLRSPETMRLLSPEDVMSRYYLRLIARDEPGVLAQVTAVLGAERISIASFLQHETPQERGVPMIFTTHQAREGSVRRALAKIAGLECVSAKPVCLRVLDVGHESA